MNKQRHALMALLVGSALLSACGGGGDDPTPVTAAPAPAPTVAELNASAQTVNENGAAIASPADAAAPDDNASAFEPEVIATDSTANPAATANDADMPSDEV